LEEINQALPSDLANAQKLLANREGIIEEGRQSAEQLVAHAREEVARMVEQTAIVAAAREESARLIEEAHIKVEKEREEVDAYIDSRLATLEIKLWRRLIVAAKDWQGQVTRMYFLNLLINHELKITITI
jgi:F0F1-type ATP synthase membrane subunit b/b'